MKHWSKRVYICCPGRKKSVAEKRVMAGREPRMKVMTRYDKKFWLANYIIFSSILTEILLSLGIAGSSPSAPCWEVGLDGFFPHPEGLRSRSEPARKRAQELGSCVSTCWRAKHSDSRGPRIQRRADFLRLDQTSIGHCTLSLRFFHHTKRKNDEIEGAVVGLIACVQFTRCTNGNNWCEWQRQRSLIPWQRPYWAWGQVIRVQDETSFEDERSRWSYP